MNAADTVFIGGKVFTADTVRSTASAVAVKGDRIVAVGHDEVRELVGAHTEVVDLAGRMLVFDDQNHREIRFLELRVLLKYRR